MLRVMTNTTTLSVCFSISALETGRNTSNLQKAIFL